MWLLFSLIFMGDLPVMTAQQWLDKCIQYHDPDQQWASLGVRYLIHETLPNKENPRVINITFDPLTQYFLLDGTYKDKAVTREWSKGQTKATLEGQPITDPEQQKKYRITEKDLHFYYGYYTYLYGLPFNLRDSGAHLAEEVKTVDFEGRQAIALSVTYSGANDGEDWSFYLDPKTAAIIGCSFVRHPGDDRPDEHLVFEEEYRVGNLILPKKRYWYITETKKYLGLDDIQAHELLKNKKN